MMMLVQNAFAAFMLAALAAATPAAAQIAPSKPDRSDASALPRAPTVSKTTGAARSILFVGNSFTQGAHSAVKRYGAATVTDLNNAGYGGVPALFKTFTEEAGLNYAVSLETQGGKTLGFHYDERRQLIDRPWDVVVLQELSTFDRARPGDTTGYRRYAPLLAAMFKHANPNVDVELMATWSRADMTYKTASPWYGKPVTAMAIELRAVADEVKAATPDIAGVIPVGEAWSRAMAAKVADPDPYDGTTYGQVDLWTYDQYHGSIYGYYLEALVVFGKITGLDPRKLGAKEKAADDLGISDQTAAALQTVAWDQLRSGGNVAR